MRDFDRWAVDTYDVIERCSDALQSLLKRSPLTHFCQRGYRGPLSLPKFITWFGGSFAERPFHIPLFTIHFDTFTEHIPISLRHRTNWVLEAHERGRPIPALFPFVAGAMDHALDERIYTSAPKEHLNLDLEVFCSSDRVSANTSALPELNPDGERGICMEMESRMRAMWGKDEVSGKNHALSWKASVDSPPCVACGWALELGGEGAEVNQYSAKGGRLEKSV